MNYGLWGYLAMSLLLGSALFFPMRNMIYTMAVRRLQKKLKRDLEPDELAGQKRRAGFIGFFVALIFALLFNYNLFGIRKI